MQSDAFGTEFKPHTHPIALHVENVEEARAELEWVLYEVVAWDVLVGRRRRG